MPRREFHPINGVYLTQELGFEEDTWGYGDEQIPCFTKVYLDTVVFVALPRQYTSQHTPKSKLYFANLTVFAFMSKEDYAADRFVCFENAYKLIEATAILDAQCAPL